MQPLFIGNTPLQQTAKTVSGTFVKLQGEDYYQIKNFDLMRPFFMSIVSASDLWMFISSNGGLTAGRKNPQFAFFPYYTDDKIQDSAELTGAKSIILVSKGGKRYLWEPFSTRYEGAYSVERQIYKHVCGHKLVFEEFNQELGLCYCYAWESSEKLGWVKRAWIENRQSESLDIELVDGIQNILPNGVNLDMQTRVSTLVDAYKKNELIAETGLGIYSLSSILVDKPEPSESLMATTVWSHGLEASQYLLSSRQLWDFSAGKTIVGESDVRAERGAYFIHSKFSLAPTASKEWHIVIEGNQGPANVADLNRSLQEPQKLLQALRDDIQQGTNSLRSIVAQADGLQLTDDRLNVNRHYANVLFNVMRGGIYDEQYQIHKADFIDFIENFNRSIASQQASILDKLPEQFSISELFENINPVKDPDFIRLCLEYLPLTFSRRHGDPSRPWNFFSIETQTEEGKKILNFQGNWRDIFQNWEALSLSFPTFTESIIAKFLNASTADGYNPYRITRKGIDWEKTDPHDPWSFIGYWGDHQIIYLLKLLELSKAHHPEQLKALAQQDIFVYANVPYRIKDYKSIYENPHDTIVFDQAAEDIIEQRVKEIGADGKLLWDEKDQIYRVNLLEKLLVPVLAKLSNFVPEAGIWLNTQRPEWNDANNALVGNGVSMVTLYYIRRYQLFLRSFITDLAGTSLSLSTEVADLLSQISECFAQHQDVLEASISDERRKVIVEQLGESATHYRQNLYKQGFSGQRSAISSEAILEWIDLSLAFIDHSIAANQRPDRLFHAYNLLQRKPDSLGIRHLYEMLEGQVAVLSANYLSVQDSVALLDAMKKSGLYREDQYSYMLYPDRQLPRFLDKNNIPADLVAASPLLQQLLNERNSKIIESDQNGDYHFSGAFRNAADLKVALETLNEQGYKITEEASQSVLNIFEKVFDHQSFTGRSGTFFAYEGLGSIYWHMVSKLLLAIGETYYRAIAEGAEASILGHLVEHYYEVRAGIGMSKNPALYGAFPIDPYSHTPGHAGAQQPGMTGQVKEDIISRFKELGVMVSDGAMYFDPALLRVEEFLKEANSFPYYDLKGEEQSIGLQTDSLAFTYCQVPIVYHISDSAKIELILSEGTPISIDGLSLGKEYSKHLFSRDGIIKQINVYLRPNL
ncbi:MAG: hypothetical protein AB8H47_26040 [Bacteroidia bacterium]